MEIITRYPLRNTGNVKKFVYEMYEENSCPVSEYTPKESKLSKKNSFVNVVSDRHSDYNKENKRMLRQLFKIFDKNEFFVCKHVMLDNNMKEIRNCKFFFYFNFI